MVKHQEVQKKAQEELDSVTRRGQIPTFDDQDSLPYISAIFKECLRWQPIVPLAIPHQLIKDDVYRDYFIPAGTTVLPNTW